MKAANLRLGGILVMCSSFLAFGLVGLIEVLRAKTSISWLWYLVELAILGIAMSRFFACVGMFLGIHPRDNMWEIKTTSLDSMFSTILVFAPVLLARKLGYDTFAIAREWS